MNYERIENSQVKATFTVSKEEFEKAMDEAFVICNEKVTIKGFRKGKAPKKMYLEHYGKESLYQDAIDCVVNSKMREELFPCKDFVVVSQPQLDLPEDIKSFEDGFDFTLTFDIYPTVKLGEYKGLEINKMDDEPTQDELDSEKNRLLASKVTKESKDGKLANGDIAVFDFEGFKDGVPFDGGKAENYELKIGSGQFIPGFEDGMLGMKKDESRDVNVTFPEDYQEKSLAGAPVVFKVLLHDIKVEVTPELTDDLVKELNIENVNTVSEFEAHIYDTLKTRKTNYNNRTMENELVDMAVLNAAFDVPASFIAEREASLRANVENQAKQYNIPFETFLQFSGVTLEAFNAQVKEEALRQVKTELVIDEIAKQENLQPTEEEIDNYILDYANSRGAKKEDIEKQIGRNPFAASLAANKAITLIVDSKVLK